MIEIYNYLFVVLSKNSENVFDVDYNWVIFEIENKFVIKDEYK